MATRYKGVIVEDDARINKDICDLLRKQSIGIRSYSGFEQAMLGALRGADYDFLITDMSFRDGTGEALIEQSQQFNPKIPIIVISETASYDYNLIPRGASFFIPKKKAHGQVYVSGLEVLRALKKSGIDVSLG